jgi:alanine-synthesizing transaminase
MYAFVRVASERLPDFDDQAFAMSLLENRHVLVAPGVSFNTPYRDHFRITNLPDPETLANVFTRIEEELDSWSRGKTTALRAVQ